MPWRPRINATKLQQAHAELARRLRLMRQELQTSERHRVGLEILLDLRAEKIDKLASQIEQLRQQNKKLDDECEHLAEIIRSAPPVDATAAAK